MGSGAVVRRGDWIQTYTGRRFWPMSPLPEDVDIEDIAHALSMLCRYNGHCSRFYSVAEHSALVAQRMSLTRLGEDDRELVLAALLHDASEAYLADVPRPVKPYLSGYHDYELAVQQAVYAAFGLQDPGVYEPLVKPIDGRILIDEAMALMPVSEDAWHTKLGAPFGIDIIGLPPHEAKALFLAMYRSYAPAPGSQAQEAGA